MDEFSVDISGPDEWKYSYQYHLEVDASGLGTVKANVFYTEETRKNMELNQARRDAEWTVAYLSEVLGMPPPAKVK